MLNCNELYTALAKAQMDMQSAYTTSDNPFFKSKYADFSEIVRASRPALTKHGLAVIQRIIILEDGSEALQSILGHSSGQYVDSIVKIRPAKSDVQSLGSYITYLKRYSYAALVGVCTDDDDGESSMQREQRSNTGEERHVPSTVTPAQLASLNDTLSSLENGTWLRARILEHNKIDSLDKLPAHKVGEVLKFILNNAPKE